MGNMGISVTDSIMIVALKSVFILSAVFLLYSNGEIVIKNEPKTVNERPIIGILSQEQSHTLKGKYAKEDYTSYIAASYVKSVEAAGARVVPILIGKSLDYYRDLLGKINGVLLPGGATWFNESNGYADAGQHIYEIAQSLNNAGDYFPIFGTCLGFELLIVLASGRGDPENRNTCQAFGNYPISFTRDYRRSKLFSHISSKAVGVLENENSTINVHKFCIQDENLQRFNLTQDWRVSSYSYDENGKKYISSIEHKRYPFYGVQFHPEKTAFEWKAQKSYVHSVNAIEANRYFMDFFVEECRKNGHSFKDVSEGNEYLIYKYKPFFTENDSAYTQCYFFEPRGIMDEAIHIYIGKSRDYYRDLLGKINGVLLPGGGTWFNESNGYADAGQHIYEIAQSLNNAGDYFPIFGTCLGFELLIVLASGRGDPENRNACQAFGNYPISFTKDYRSSKLFSRINSKAVGVLENEDSTINFHTFCIQDENLQRFNLTQDWRVSSYSYDENGKKYISSIEHKRYPFYGVQFHPEKTAFEWKAQKSYVHSVNAIEANRYFMDFFVEECRKNGHSFKDVSEGNEYLIYKYQPFFTENDSFFTQCYFFEPRGMTDEPYTFSTKL